MTDVQPTKWQRLRNAVGRALVRLALWCAAHPAQVKAFIATL